MRKPDQPHDHFFAEVFSQVAVARDLVEQFLPQNVVDKLDLDSLHLEPTSFVTPELKKRISDLVFLCKKKGRKDKVTISLIKEHKSYRPRYPHFQLLDYIQEKWRQERKNKKKPTAVICVLLYHGKRAWKYKKMGSYIAGMDEELEQFNPLFDFVLIDLNKYSDEFILDLKVGFLVNALLVLKHSGEENYIKRNFYTLLVHYEKYENDEMGLAFIRTIFVYISKTTEIGAKEILNMVKKSPILKKKFVSGWDRDMANAKLETQNKIHLDIIRNGWEMQLEPKLIAKLGNISIEKVKKEIAKLEAAKKNSKNKNGSPNGNKKK